MREETRERLGKPASGEQARRALLGLHQTIARRFAPLHHGAPRTGHPRHMNGMNQARADGLDTARVIDADTTRQ